MACSVDLQRVDQVPLRDEAVLDQHVAQTLVGLLLNFQGFLNLLRCDYAGGYQQVAQPHISHIITPNQHCSAPRRDTKKRSSGTRDRSAVS